MKSLFESFRATKRALPPFVFLALWAFLPHYSRAASTYPNNIADDQDELLSGMANVGSTGVPSWQVSEPYINLWVFDQPLTYETSFGESLGFGLAFKQRNARSKTKIFNLGPSWESSWLSYFEYTLDGSSPQKATAGTNYVALGGSRNYVAGGVAKEFKSSSTMTILTNVSGLIGFQVSKPSGARDIYSYLFQVSAGENYALLSQQIDSVGRTNFLNYDTVSSVVRLRSMVDSDYRTNLVLYHATWTNQIKEVDGPYGTKATFGYDGSGRLTSITNVGGLASTFSYDSLGLVTNLVTVYGTTSFSTTTNSYGGFNLGGTNQINRSITVIEPDGGKQLFLYRDQSTKLYAGSSVDLIPTNYPSGDVPVTSPLSNTFDTTEMDARNSFSWNQLRYGGLNATFRSSGLFTDLTTNDYQIAVLKHWLRGYTNATVVTDTISLARGASVDGTINGQKTWFDYAGKVTDAWTRGTNASPRFVAMVLPDGTNRYSYFERNNWEKPTRIVDTYTSGASVSYRTNDFTFSSDGIDLITALGPSSELLSSNIYNGFHQVATNYNAVIDMTVFTFDAGHRLTSVIRPTGLVTTNFYFTSGLHTNWLDRSIDYETSLSTAFRTNAFTYTNGLILTSTDPRGLITTNTWDNLRRVTSIAIPAGTITNLYTALDLTNTVSPSGTITNWLTYDSMQRVCRTCDARSSTSGVCYVRGVVTAVTNALLQSTSFNYDFTGNQLITTFPDLYSLTYGYNSLGQRTNSTDAVGIGITNCFNNQGLHCTSSNGFGQVFANLYDLRDRVTNSVSAEGVTVSTTYDNMSRVLTKTYPDGGVEKFQYSARGLITYTNQLGFITRFVYDALGRKTAETNANGEVTQYAYNAAGSLVGLTDGKGHTNQWGYDEYGRNTNMVDSTGTTIMRLKYDQDGRLTNRWTAAKGDTGYKPDQNGNVTNITYLHDTTVSFDYDVLNRVTIMRDGAGTSSYGYYNFGALAMEDGPWDSDEIYSGYQDNHMKYYTGMRQPNGNDWWQRLTYDLANRIQYLASPAGTFGVYYGAGSLLKKLVMPPGAYTTNTFDSVGRRTSTTLANNANTILNSHSYVYNAGNQRTKQSRTLGDYVDYTYDAIGQLKTAIGKESGGSARLHENFGFAYDAGNNLSYRTNNALLQTFTVDSLNQLTTAARSGTMTVAGTVAGTATNVTSVTVADNGNAAAAATVYADKSFARSGVSVLTNNTLIAVAQDSYGRMDTNTVTVALPASVSYSYDANGSLTNDGTRSFTYDDENRLSSVTVATNWATAFVHDGRNRVRIRRESNWVNSAWAKVSETRYVYDGNLVIQERDGNNTPTVTYTRGWDLSGTCCDGAGGIGGLLARTDNAQLNAQVGDPHSYYHSDGNGNVTMLVNSSQQPVARYIYDPYGNTIAKSGPLSDANVYRFSSKEYHANSGLYSFGRRFYDPNLQRWVNRDPSGIEGGINIYEYVANSPVNATDAWGFAVQWTDTAPIATSLGDVMDLADIFSRGKYRGIIYGFSYIDFGGEAITDVEYSSENKTCYYRVEANLTSHVLYSRAGEYTYAVQGGPRTDTLLESFSQDVLAHEQFHIEQKKAIFLPLFKEYERVGKLIIGHGNSKEECGASIKGKTDMLDANFRFQRGLAIDIALSNDYRIDVIDIWFSKTSSGALTNLRGFRGKTAAGHPFFEIGMRANWSDLRRFRVFPMNPGVKSNAELFKKL